ncbi:class II glutamine amidotransferase [Acidithiobacillus sp. M4-SHS-6]|uniref:class II glutamine amidotransferase n=1 Tax=Acidithiobacillus sp. M4-SHS-6 TaxID=3383024 RepID=UPI0039BE2175
MCLIIVSDKPSKITKTVVQSAARRNADGVGVMWYDEVGKLQTRKWMSTPLKKWWPEWRKICRQAEAAGSELAVHWRMATHGAINLEMCHPYPIEVGNDTVQMMHNGILSGYGEKDFSLSVSGGVAQADDARSDTYEYARMVESILVDGGVGLVSNSAFLALLGTDIGSGNKLVFGIPINPDKDFRVVNRDSGLMYEGHWFSNTYAWDYPKRKTYPTTTNYPLTKRANDYLDSRYGSYSGYGYGKSATRDNYSSGMSLETVVNIFRQSPDEALETLSEVPFPSLRLSRLLELAEADRVEARVLLLDDIEFFAEEYYDTCMM